MLKLPALIFGIVQLVVALLHGTIWLGIWGLFVLWLGIFFFGIDFGSGKPATPLARRRVVAEQAIFAVFAAVAMTSIIFMHHQALAAHRFR
jgi:hypothetical protein